MSLLEKRANFLMAGKFEKANEMEVKMTELKNDKYDELTTPKNFFCTFHYEQAYQQALFTNTMMFEGEETKIDQATEPSDIVWENRHVRANERRCRMAIAIFIMILCSFGAFAFMVWIIKKKLLI